ncbi:Imidazole glycerol phosphate synthase subunit HisH 1 [compost metagenome]
MYFVHSYYVKPDDNAIRLTLTNYDDIEFCSSVIKDNIFATQFHPEKSADKGVSIYKNWAITNNLL